METGLIVYGIPIWNAVLIGSTIVLWVAMLWLVFSVILHANERVICPLAGRQARLTLLRGPDGAVRDVLGCSLIEHPPFTCDKRCLPLVRA